jgi:hypothetical protein
LPSIFDSWWYWELFLLFSYVEAPGDANAAAAASTVVSEWPTIRNEIVAEDCADGLSRYGKLAAAGRAGKLASRSRIPGLATVMDKIAIVASHHEVLAKKSLLARCRYEIG